MVVIAIDVGLKISGYAVCNVVNTHIEVLRDGQIVTKASSSLPQRIYYIYQKVSSLIDKYNPQVLILEKLYSHYKHPVTLGVLAQVRGSIVLLAEHYNLKFYEFSPTKAKKAILGRGNARSHQIKKMVENILKRPVGSQHIADAFSLIVAFSHNSKIKELNEFRNS